MFSLTDLVVISSLLLLRVEAHMQQVDAAPVAPHIRLNVATQHLLDAYPEAKCLDGTPAQYYLRSAANKPNSTKWVIHIQGGGWCSSQSSCKSRASSRLGSSSKKYNNNATMDLNKIEGCDNNRWCGALMVNDESINPLAYDWNAAFLYYCDGASWTGNMADPVDGLYYRGWQNMKAVMTDLLTNRGLDQATDVLIGGDSAGGLATFYHIDYMNERIQNASPTARVLGMPDSGYWPDDPAEAFTSTFVDMNKMQNSTDGLDAACVAANPKNLTTCLFPQYFASMIQTPLFPLQSIYDPLQKGSHPQSHGAWLANEFTHTILSNPKNGAWLHSCERHCGAELLTIDGIQYPRAVEEFFYSGVAPAKKLWFQNATYPCSACCNDGVSATSFN
jgi:hypothetical protein